MGRLGAQGQGLSPSPATCCVTQQAVLDLSELRYTVTWCICALMRRCWLHQSHSTRQEKGPSPAQEPRASEGERLESVQMVTAPRSVPRPLDFQDCCLQPPQSLSPNLSRRGRAGESRSCPSGGHRGWSAVCLLPQAGWFRQKGSPLLPVLETEEARITGQPLARASVWRHPMVESRRGGSERSPRPQPAVPTPTHLCGDAIDRSRGQVPGDPVPSHQPRVPHRCPGGQGSSTWTLRTRSGPLWRCYVEGRGHRLGFWLGPNKGGSRPRQRTRLRVPRGWRWALRPGPAPALAPASACLGPRSGLRFAAGVTQSPRLGYHQRQ